MTGSLEFRNSLLTVKVRPCLLCNSPRQGLLGTFLRVGDMLPVRSEAGVGALFRPSRLGFYVSSPGTEQMLSHGTADVVLEACTDFWDGADIYPLSGSDRWVRSLPVYLPVSVMGHLRTTYLPFPLLPWQKESAGFLPASLPVWLLLCLRLQAYELCPVLPAQWQVY